MNYVIVDVETTGGSTHDSKITEIALFKHDGKSVIDSYSTLINPEMPIPFFITKLTGISDSMVQNAPTFAEINHEIMDFVKGCVFVAHNVSFDYSMIRHEFKLLNKDFRLPHLCTVRASRYVLPGYESYSLGKLTKSLGINLVGRHRATGDAEATAELFTMLIQKDKTQLSTFIQEEIDTSILNPQLNLFLLDEIPNRPGFFLFLNEENEVCFVGKGKELRKQIEKTLRTGDLKLLPSIVHIEYELSGTELIAEIMATQKTSALFENNQPKTVKNSKFEVSYFTNSLGQTKLLIEKSNGFNTNQLAVFKTKKEAISYVHHFLDSTNCSFEECVVASKNDIQFSSDNLNPIQITDNLMCKIEQLIQQKESYYLLGKGRTKYERSIVWVENEQIIRFGFIPQYLTKQGSHTWTKHLTNHVECLNSEKLLNAHLKKKSFLVKIPK